MATNIHGIMDWAVQDPGPADRWAAMGNLKTTLVAATHHSMEGKLSLVSSPASGYNAMRDPNRFPTAWHGSTLREARALLFPDGSLRPFAAGTHFQHFPLNAQLQHGNYANILGPGWEAEDWPHLNDSTLSLLPEQEETYLRLHWELARFSGNHFTRLPSHISLFSSPPASTAQIRGLIEHRQVGQTACPSNLYTNLWKRIAAGDSYGGLMSTEYNELKEEIRSLRLSVHSGAEEAELSVDARDHNARYRVDEIVAGRRPSVGDSAGSAIALAVKVAAASGSAGAILALLGERVVT